MKTKAERSASKSEHSQNNKSENQSVLGNGNRMCLSPKEVWCNQPTYSSKIRKQQPKTKTKMFQEQHNNA